LTAFASPHASDPDRPLISWGPGAPKHYTAVVVLFVTALLCSNLIGPGKACAIGGVSFAVGSLFFPVTYLANDVLAEVYGLARARRAIWLGFGALLFAALASQLVIVLPVNTKEPFSVMLQPALDLVFGASPRVVVASLLAFLAGDLVNAHVLVRIKRRTGQRLLWVRTIGSTVAGQAIDSAIFFPLAFFGIWSASTLLTVVLTNWLIKVLVEAAMTPVTYRIVSLLRRAETPREL
jgi:uncharacterized integral membrane protein (TIGR00697 family)